jgi:DNA-directed RNA polymerase specialized sigma24 family protein
MVSSVCQKVRPFLTAGQDDVREYAGGLMPGDIEGGPRRFPTTSWSLVALAADEGPDAQREALEELLVHYLPAMRAHLVYAKRMAPDDAADLLQDFVTTKVLERDLIAQADQRLGKFRTFLLVSLDRYWLNQLRDRGAQKRKADMAEALGDHADRLATANAGADAFHTAWARDLLKQSLDQMRAECESTGRDEVWGVFECRVLEPALHGTESIGYDALVERFGFRSPSQASNTLATAKRMFARLLRSAVSQYAGSDEEIEEELDDLRKVLGSHGTR